MTATSVTADDRANPGTAAFCVNRRRALRLNACVMQKSRDLFPVKTAAHLADLTGYSQRACEYWLAGGAVIPADALAALLQSSRGREFLAAVMADAAPRWWLALKAFIKSVDLAAEQRAHRRKLQELLDADHQALALPFAAALQDAEFYGAQPRPPGPGPDPRRRAVGAVVDGRKRQVRR
jgi:hypothetical protein